MILLTQLNLELTNRVFIQALESLILFKFYLFQFSNAAATKEFYDVRKEHSIFVECRCQSQTSVVCNYLKYMKYDYRELYDKNILQSRITEHRFL